MDRDRDGMWGFGPFLWSVGFASVYAIVFIWMRIAIQGDDLSGGLFCVFGT